MRSGYADAIGLAESALAKLEMQAVCAKCGVRFDGGYILPWFGGETRLSDGSETERVLWLHYLVSEGAGRRKGELISFREIAGAFVYDPKFRARAVAPLVGRFGKDPEAFVAAGKKLGGTVADGGREGRFKVELPLLPHVPVTYLLWANAGGDDDELPPDGQILFDRTAPGWLPPEDLTVLASLGTYRMIKHK
ncbi:MAG: DUF3786 domain-containing protein [Defluviitaleaceae bacterium]|nr:DUF3786 domain-containing protein [Defluviitaleaceae bacterium]